MAIVAIVLIEPINEQTQFQGDDVLGAKSLESIN
jgi:hypothetical protein